MQKRPERYHIPAAIRHTGRDKISRIFRDREELTITALQLFLLNTGLQEENRIVCIRKMLQVLKDQYKEGQIGVRKEVRL